MVLKKKIRKPREEKFEGLNSKLLFQYNQIRTTCWKNLRFDTFVKESPPTLDGLPQMCLHACSEASYKKPDLFAGRYDMGVNLLQIAILKAKI